MRRLLSLMLLACLFLLLAAPALAERRVALVIGNAAYRVGPLRNPVNDAEDMSGVLKRLGFEVVLLRNAGNRQMDEAVRQFSAKLKTGALGLFYFSGHGVELGGTNYLVPVDTNIQSDADIRNGCLNAQWVLEKMEDAGNGRNVMVLDACRDSPFPKSVKSGGRGLANMTAADGSLVAFATSPGKTAADGAGRNGAYTKHLLQNLATPGLTLVDVFMRTQGSVRAETGKAQVPWFSSSLSGHLYLAGQGGQYAPPPAPTQYALAPIPKERPQQAPPPAQADTWRDPVTQMEFVWVPQGCFQMGSNEYSSEVHHEACISGLWLGKYEVTQGQWQRVMGNNPSSFKEGDNYPVDQVSWTDAKEFISKLNAQGSAKFRLPTEAEWEYAARSGGRPEKYAGGNDVGSVAWYDSNSGGSMHAVGTKAPNGLGLYDMSGNVWEWCEDVYSASAYSSHLRENPLYGGGGSVRVIRGGSWFDRPTYVRSSNRGRAPQDNRDGDRSRNIGFRLVRVSGGQY